MIEAFATYMNPRLAPELLPKCTSTSYPNILGLDYIADTVPVAVSTAIHCLSDKAEYHSAVPANYDVLGPEFLTEKRGNIMDGLERLPRW